MSRLSQKKIDSEEITETLMINSFNLRLEQGILVISSDDGCTTSITDRDVVNNLNDKIQYLFSKNYKSKNTLSAPAIGMLYESKLIKPVDYEEEVHEKTKDGTQNKFPLGAIVRSDSNGLKNVLEERYSERSFSPIGLSDLATLLVRTARIVSWNLDSEGSFSIHKPVPSAGGKHPIELKVLALQVKDLKSGLYDFNSLNCELSLDESRKIEREDVIKKIMAQGHLKNEPAAIVFAVAYFGKTLKRYPNGSSLVWRDAGVLMQTLHLCAVDIDLASCLLGTCGMVEFDLENEIADILALAIGTHHESVN